MELKIIDGHQRFQKIVLLKFLFKKDFNMLYQVGKDENDTEGIFQKLSKNTIILCDEVGFQKMKDMFLPFKENQEGNKNYLFDFDNEDDVVAIKDISENEIDVCIVEQTIKLFWFRNLMISKLKTFKYNHSEDIWFSTFKEVYALTTFKKHEIFQPFSKFMRNICRFDHRFQKM